MAWKRIASKEISQTILRGSNPNIEVTGLGYGDSTLFVGDRNRPAVYQWNGSNLSPLIIRRYLRDAAGAAGTRFGDSSTRNSARLGAVTFIGDSTLVVGDTGNDYLLYFNSVTGRGITSRHIKLPSTFNVKGITDSGDSIPWIYDSHSNAVKEWKLVHHDAVYRTEEYQDTIYVEEEVAGDSRTEYRVTGERVGLTTRYTCADLNTGIQRFVKTRFRYNAGDWQSSYSTAIAQSERTEDVRSAYQEYTRILAVNPDANSCLLRRDIGFVYYARIPNIDINIYEPVVETRQVQTTTTRVVPRTVTRQRRIQVSPERSVYEWVDKISTSEINKTGASTIGGMTKDNDQGIYLSTPTKAYYFLNNRRSTNSSAHDLTYGDTINPQAITWDDGGLFYADTDNDEIKYQKREDIFITFTGEPGTWNVRPVQPPLPAWERRGDTKDIDLINDLGFHTVIPTALTFDGTNLYFGDRNSNRIFKVNPSTKADSGLITLSSYQHSIDSMTYGDSKLFIGDDRSRKILVYNTNGDSLYQIDLPDGVIPSGLGYNGDSIPDVVDSFNDRIISYETRKEITPATYGDSFFNSYSYENFDDEQIVTKYRVTGDTVGPSTFISCSNAGDSTYRTAKRYKSSDVLYGTQDEARTGEEYDFTYKTVCEEKTYHYNDRITETVYDEHQELVSAARTEYRVNGERASGTTSFSCGDLRTNIPTRFEKRRTRYGTSGWTTSSQGAVNAARRTETVRVRATYTCITGSFRSRSKCYFGSCQTFTLVNGKLEPTRGVYEADIPSPIPTYSPKIETRTIPAVYRTVRTPRQVVRIVPRQGVRITQEIKTWNPVFQEVGDTVVTPRTIQIVRKNPIKVLTSSGDSKLITGWGDKVSTSELQRLNPNIRPSGLTYIGNNSFVLDADNDQAFFLHNGREVRSGDRILDLPQGILRLVNFNIFPSAITSDNQYGAWIADSYNKVLWWFEFKPRIEISFTGDSGTWSIKPDISRISFTGEPGTWNINITPQVNVPISFTGDSGTWDIELASHEAIEIHFTGDSGTWSVEPTGIPAIDVPISFTGDSGTWGVAITPQVDIPISFTGGEPSWDVLITPNVNVPISFTGDSGTWGINLPEPINIPISFTGDSGTWSVAPIGIPAVDVPISFTGDSGTWNVEVHGEKIVNVPISFTGDSGTWNIEPTIYTPITKYIEFGFRGNPGFWDITAVEQVPTPNLVKENTPEVVIPIVVPVDPGERSEASKYKAHGYNEFSVERVLPPRAIIGDTFPDTPFSRSVKTRERTILSAAVPQLLPPVITAVQQGRQVIIRWDEQRDLWIHRNQVQVSQNEDGPWFAPSGGDTVHTGDSYAEFDGQEAIIPNVPLSGSEDFPVPRPLCYRVRRIDNDGEVSEWSQPAMVVVKPTERKETGARTISSAKLVTKLWGSQGSGDNLAYWSLDDTLEGRTPFQLGIMRDTSQDGIANPLKITGPNILGVQGIVKRALYFDGNNDTSYAITNRVGDTGDSWDSISMMGFINGGPRQQQTLIGLLSYHRNNDNYINITYSPSNRIYRLKFGDSFILNSDPIDLLNNQWHQVGFTYNFTTKKAELWLDGELLKSTTFSTTKTSILQGGYFGIGGIVGNNNLGFKITGKVDEVRIWNRILTQQEFSFFVNSPKGVDGPTVVTNENILPDSLDVSRIKADQVETLFALVRNSITIGQDINVAKGNKRTHADADEFSLQTYNGTAWRNDGSFYGDTHGSHIILSGDTVTNQIDFDQIVFTNNNDRAINKADSSTFYKKAGSSWLIKSQINKDQITFFEDDGTKKIEIGENKFSIGDTIEFSNNYFITKSTINKLQFSGEIEAAAIVPQNRFTGGSIKQKDLFVILNNSTSYWMKMDCYGVLNSAKGGNQVFEGDIKYAERKSGNLFYLYCVNTKNKTAQTMKVNLNLDVVLFDVFIGGF